MTESDRQLIQHVLEGQRALQTAVSQVHVIAGKTRAEMGAVAKRQEDFIEAHGTFVRETETKLETTAAQVSEWKAQQKLVLRVATLVGGSGLLALASSIVQALHK